MPSHHCNDLVVLKRQRFLSSTNDGHIIFENSTELSRPIRPSSKNRRATLVGIPPSLINTSTQDLQTNLHIQPTVFFYRAETFQEACYRSIEDIRNIDNNECLWIDVTGVSCMKKLVFIYFTC
jgi:hypothetical protein